MPALGSICAAAHASSVNVGSALYKRCIDPEGNLVNDDILDGFEADGRMLTSEYLFGFIDGVQAAIKDAKRRPENDRDA